MIAAETISDQPYRIELTQQAEGIDVSVAQWNGQTFSVASAAGTTQALARKLIEAGAPDGPWEAVGQNWPRRFGGPSLYRLARLESAA
jgi:hypothetical protein